MKDIWAVLPIALCVAAAAQNGSISAVHERTYITHVTVVDTETGKEVPDRTVIVSGDKISNITDSRSTTTPANAKIVDGRGKYLIPGLWDMHVHGTNYESTLPLYIANGVTGVREMFGPPDANKVRAELARSNIIAPHLYLASPIVDGNPPIWPNSIKVETPQEARRVVDQQKQHGADFIKVYSRLSREAYFAIMDEAQHQNIAVAGHVPTRITAWEATAAKQKSIEHLMDIPLACSTQEEELRPAAAKTQSMLEGDKLELDAWRSYSHDKCDRLFQEFKKNGTRAVPTLMVYKTFGLLTEPKFRKDAQIGHFSGEFRGLALRADSDPRLKAWTTADFRSSARLFKDEQGLVKELLVQASQC